MCGELSMVYLSLENPHSFCKMCRAGMAIPIGKLDLYVGAAGFNPGYPSPALSPTFLAHRIMHFNPNKLPILVNGT